MAEHGHWPAFAASSDFRIIAVVERTAERRDVAKRLDPSVATVASLHELGNTDIDFIDICTPPSLHGEPMLLGLSRGWHVLCEKPFVLDLATFGAIRGTAVRGNLAVVPVHNWKYAPIIRRATTLLREGIIGPLQRVTIETLRLKDCATADPDHPNWRRDPAIAGGGVLMDHGWHAIYLAMHWFGERPSAVGASLHWPTPGEVEDEARVIVKFPHGNAEILLSWNADIRRNVMTLEGELGELVVADGVLNIRTADAEGQIAFTNPLSAGSYHTDWFTDLLPDVVRAFADPASSRPWLDEAGVCLTTVQQAYRAAGAATPATVGIGL